MNDRLLIDTPAVLALANALVWFAVAMGGRRHSMTCEACWTTEKLAHTMCRS
jgi:hypothetical protein